MNHEAATSHSLRVSQNRRCSRRQPIARLLTDSDRNTLQVCGNYVSIFRPSLVVFIKFEEQHNLARSARSIMSGLPSFSFDGSTASSTEEAFWSWRSITSPLFDVALPAPGAVKAFKVEVDSYHLGPLVLGSVTANAQQFRRSSLTIARSGVNHYLVQLYLQGGYGGGVEPGPTHAAPPELSKLPPRHTLQNRVATI